MDFVAIDFETANERRNSACAVGMAKVRNGEVVDTFFSLIRPPEMRFERINVSIHGIEMSHVKDSPSFAELWPTMQEFAENSVLVAHNASFDMSVLRHSLHEYDLESGRISYLCSLNISRASWPEAVSHNLGFLARLHGIELVHHDAKSDACASAKLILLAANKAGAGDLTQLLETIPVTIGAIYSTQEWLPSAGISYRRGAQFEIELPADYDVTKHPLFNKTVVFTQGLIALPRRSAENWVELLGGFAGKGVTKYTSFLVVGDCAALNLADGATETSKLKKAKALRQSGHGIQIITEQDFTELIFDVTTKDSGDAAAD